MDASTLAADAEVFFVFLVLAVIAFSDNNAVLVFRIFLAESFNCLDLIIAEIKMLGEQFAISM